MSHQRAQEADQFLVVSSAESDDGCWHLFRRPPAAALKPYILGDYHGWIEQSAGVQLRREMPRVMVPVIFNFGTPFTIAGSVEGGGETPAELFQSFAAGLHDRYVVTGSSGLSRCLQVNFTLLGAYRLGLDLPALARRIVTAEDAFGQDVRMLIAEFAEAESWSRRFDRLEHFILARFADDTVPHADVLAALRHLQQSRGQMRIGQIAGDLGLSRKRLIGLFQAEIGLTPKNIAQLLRFSRALSSLRHEETSSLADLAAACGYYDQAHFNRDFKLYSGFTPTEMLAKRLPGVESLAH